MGDQEHRQPQRLLQLAGLFVERSRADRVQPGRRLVQKQQVRVQRQRARQPRPLLHPARQFRRIFGTSLGRETSHPDLVGGDFVAQFRADIGIIFADRHFDIFRDGQRGKQRAALKQHAPTLADRQRLIVGTADHRFAKDVDFPLVRGLKADDRPHQHRFAGARPADNAHDLALAHVKVQPVMHHLIAKTVAYAAHRNRDVALLHHGFDPLFLGDDVLMLGHQFHPTQVKNTANIASRTMTRKMACTTAAVVRSPTSSALPLTCIP